MQSRAEETWKLTLEAVQDEVKELKANLKDATELKALQEVEFKRQIAAMSTENYLSTQKAEENLAKLAKLQAELGSQEADFKMRLEEKRLEIERLEGKLKEGHKNLENFDKLKADLLVAERLRQSHETEQETLRVHLKALETELNSTKSKLNAALTDAEHIRRELQETQEKTKGLQETETELLTELAEKKLQHDLLIREKDDELKLAEAQIAQKKLRINELETTVQETDEASSKLRLELASAETSTRDLKAQLGKLTTALEEARARKTDSDEIKRETDGRLEQLLTLLQETKSRSEFLQNQNLARETELNAMRDISQAEDSLRSEHAHLQGKHKELLAVEASLRLKLFELEKEQAQLRHDLAVKLEAINKLEIKAQEDAADSKETTQKLIDLTKELERSDTELKNQKHKLKGLKDEMRELQLEIEKNKAAHAVVVAKLNTEATASTAKLNEVKSKFKERETALKQKKRALEAELENLRQTQRESTLKIEMQLQQISELEALTHTQTNEGDSQLTQLLEANKAHQAEIQAKSLEVERLTIQLEVSKNITAKLESKLEEKSRQVTAEFNQVNETQSQVLIEQISELKEQLRQSKELTQTQASLQVDILKNSLEEERERVRQLSEQIRSIKNKSTTSPKPEEKELYSTPMQGTLKPDPENSKDSKVQAAQAGKCGCELF